MVMRSLAAELDGIIWDGLYDMIPKEHSAAKWRLRSEILLVSGSWSWCIRHRCSCRPKLVPCGTLLCLCIVTVNGDNATMYCYSRSVS